MTPCVEITIAPKEAPGIRNGEPDVAALGPLQLRRVSTLTAAERRALERLAYKFGESPESYLAIEPERFCLVVPDFSAAISVIPAGRCLHCSGGLLAPVSVRRAMVRCLSEYARQTQRLIACYSVGEADRPFFEEAGWEVSKFGEDPTIRLGDLDWKGKSFEWVRRQANYCRRKGLVVREIDHRALAPEAWHTLKSELAEIHTSDLRNRIYSREMNLLTGKFQPDNLESRRLFIAENPQLGRIAAFIIANPMQGGKSWALESFRRRHEAIRGSIPFLMKSIIDALQEEKVESASLSLLIWKDCRRFRGNRMSRLLSRCLIMGYEIGNLLYHTKGLTHFKTRFRPELKACYLCVTPQTTPLSILNFLYTVGAFSIDLPNCFRLTCRGIIRALRRSTSHTP
ncbi:MAG: DUF2156 domain-containing protein [Planctomycetes bacterium]|nr:DUF2156 domain-containing protein [Planctomycetota bacterium]